MSMTRPESLLAVAKEKNLTKGITMNPIRTLASIAALMLTSALVGCAKEADVASHNLSIAADQFQVMRRVVFYNGITGGYILSIEGLCSLGNADSAQRMTVTCKTGPGVYKKHFLGLSDNVTFFAEQLQDVGVNVYHYKVIFRPQTILPNIDLEVGK